ncbi:MAG: hypothetical protein A2790_20025 [Phenylobacterium sp. RIFCSPHIGHO2_01_FULL_69_31]|uniref:hypothetical protein n=1 Tax=Phenylobacterium sp. RIFCSPHIGHO2_01_FULL_69_31 TaxID=1801944 RepID=UPI0008CB8D4D|nr:hypothetical protein [Phenylobacterium sp. RIFCSPHIGHO2_01_FULL_69_31]OHB26256.1 MAG: hypothetical protein A2790_20025 [Phenylobacterium sp. RIFCSPHIGHO2_01_FULL_69_31]
MAANDNTREALETALANLVHQVDIGDYRDAKGHDLHNNLAFLQAQELVDRYGLTHEKICWALDECNGDLRQAAEKLAA